MEELHIMIALYQPYCSSFKTPWGFFSNQQIGFFASRNRRLYCSSIERVPPIPKFRAKGLFISIYMFITPSLQSSLLIFSHAKNASINLFKLSMN